MKRLLWCAVSFLLMCATCFRVPLVTLAAVGEVTFWGRSERFSFAPGSGYTATDLFPGFKDVMPGDLLTEVITVKNQSWQHGDIKLYLRVVPHDSENPASYNENYENINGKDQTGIPNQRDETLTGMVDFLSQMTLRVYRGDTLIFEDALCDPVNSTNAVFLGTLERYHTMELKLELEVPEELDNHYANRVGETDWIFMAEVFENPQKPDIPKTGDMILAAVVIMAISGLLFVLILLTGRRRK